MLTIYTTEAIDGLAQMLEPVEGLRHQIKFVETVDAEMGQQALIIADGQINLPLAWQPTEPPLLWPPCALSPGNLQAVCLTKLGYASEGAAYATDAGLQAVIKLYSSLISGEPDEEPGTSVEPEYQHLHNQALYKHFFGGDAIGTYQQALPLTPTSDHQAFTLKQLAAARWQANQGQEALQAIAEALAIATTPEAKYSLSSDQIAYQMSSWARPFTDAQLGTLKSSLWACIRYYEAAEVPVLVASLLVQASEIANQDKSYAESLGYIQRAIDLYMQEQIPEQLAEAWLRKGTLLYTWAQDGNPQFYQQAIKTYQEALQVFSEANAPLLCAEIYQNLGVIHAEMPGPEQQRTIWASISANSFMKCFDLINKTYYPYEWAMIANNYGNALLKYPPAKQGDNTEKAISYYLEALAIRSAAHYPLERAHTLLNYLEACWEVNNINTAMERVRQKDMHARAKEVLQLSDDPALRARAQEHLDRLQQLAITLNQPTSHA